MVGPDRTVLEQRCFATVAVSSYCPYTTASAVQQPSHRLTLRLLCSDRWGVVAFATANAEAAACPSGVLTILTSGHRLGVISFVVAVHVTEVRFIGRHILS